MGGRSRVREGMGCHTFTWKQHSRRGEDVIALDVRSNRRAGLVSVSYEDKIKEQARPYLQAGERVLAAFMARPRGATATMAGGLALGGMKTAQQSAQP